ncbi:MAG: hypothetical protein H6733_05430 [Alphaproteobacteria bacterium]|nr:hypothetical protein [Alphaproteobacteria bacterium]
MIEMSRSARHRRGRSGDLPGRSSLVALWHALCWVPMAGCFYVKPIPQIEINQLPEIAVPLSNPEYRRVTSDRVTLSIVASDPDGDPVGFEWPDLDDVLHEREDRTEGEFARSRVVITDLDALQSDTITALVHDDRPVNTVEVVFYLELP